MGSDFFSKTNPRVIIEEGLFTNNTPSLNGTGYFNRTMIIAIEKKYMEYNRLGISDDDDNLFMPDECPVTRLKEMNLPSSSSYSTYCIDLNDYLIGSIYLNFRECSEFPASLIRNYNITCIKDDPNVNMKNARMYIFVPELGFNPGSHILS
jgi:hypothetical protein